VGKYEEINLHARAIPKVLIEVPVESLRDRALKFKIEFEIEFFDEPDLKRFEENLTPGEEARSGIPTIIDLIRVKDSEVTGAV